MIRSSARSNSGSASGALVASVIAIVVVLGVGFLLLDRIDKLESEQEVLRKAIDQGTTAKTTPLPQDLDARLKHLESEQTSLRSNLAMTKMDHAGMIDKHYKELESDLGKLETALRSDLDKLRKEISASPAKTEQLAPLDTRLKEVEAGLNALKSELAKVSEAKRLAALDSRLKRVEAGQIAMKSELAKVPEAKQLAALDSRLKQVEAGQKTVKSGLTKAGTERRKLGERTDAFKTSQDNQDKGLLALKTGQGNLDAQLLDLQNELSTRLRAIKEKILRSNYHCSDSSVRGDHFFPFQKHFPYLGISFEFLDETASEQAGLKPGNGIIITQVHSKGPARDIGLRTGDIILRVSGVPVSRCGLPGECMLGDKWINRADLPNYVNTFIPGDTVEVQYKQGGDLRKAKVQLSCRVDGKGCAFYHVPLKK